MRYILDDLGYVESVSCNHIECDSKSCTEYKGKIPLGYYSLEEWATKGNIRAYKIVDGNLTYDPDRAAAIESEMRKGFYPSKYSQDEIIIGEWLGKPLYRKTLFYASSEGNQKFVPNHNIENFEGIVDAYGRFTRVSTGIQCLIPMNYTSWETWIYDFTATNYVLRWSDAQWNAGVKDIYVTLEYTKTTDEVREEENFFEEPDLSIDANIPQEEPTRSIVIADSWQNYNNGSPEGTMAYNNLDVWMYNWDETNNKLDGVSLDFTIEGTYNMIGSFTFSSYEGCPRNVGAYIFKDGVLYKELPYQFDALGTAFVAELNENLDTGTYQLVLGAYPDYEFGVSGSVNFI